MDQKRDHQADYLARHLWELGAFESEDDGSISLEDEEECEKESLAREERVSPETPGSSAPVQHPGQISPWRDDFAFNYRAQGPVEDEPSRRRSRDEQN